MIAAEIITRRRKWKPEEKATLLAEVEAEGGRVSVVAAKEALESWRAT
jgi:transposase-like protein